MYFFEGSEVCLKVMPVFAVMSSSCGIGRPLHLVVLAPGGGGVGARMTALRARDGGAQENAISNDSEGSEEA